ncbi:MAG TPA: hypothetical protein PKH31_15265, partial [Candidatus Sumerlaeota bacterium]|nr:hypothetical protein [Candidatus Sumerlaeota bacterium]
MRSSDSSPSPQNIILKTAVEDRNEFFVFIVWAENGSGSLPFWVKSFDRANREIGAPGNRFLP